MISMSNVRFFKYSILYNVILHKWKYQRSKYISKEKMSRSSPSLVAYLLSLPNFKAQGRIRGTRKESASAQAYSQSLVLCETRRPREHNFELELEHAKSKSQLESPPLHMR